MNNITLIAVGALKNKALQTLAADYEKRIAPYARFKLIETSASPFGKNDKNRSKRQENEVIEKVVHKLPKADIFLLAEKGNVFDSPSFASFLNEYDGRDLVLVIGGALGWEEEFRKRYKCISLSTLTFPHELARVVLLEQIYRGLLINAGKDYHY
ncbi:23S rRNA (pseudouridine(1915)-N(3))-methyltransferase RlmH [Candidatus Falkowbacteria bacterium HGW-Falkowbacteria-2]|uniref:Ribosomal RNA large subunit methyltransferase H n=1 Tax=Candidatus Falkowbacteria bacterium HGW-Falkowbacteria-2 TaxID=2013769 RepID=A0A2N2E3W2_9BACT|nr:MAG: 23S rRNA (pseudouridine(1915)-N(3))-methyltransferase RlmH [Candidatus Falkowbacteria bacterium HGW-Falkowbacteria-2]